MSRLRGVVAYVALGSNLGDREANLRDAVARLAGTPGLRPLRASRLWETPAVGPPQPDYLNAVVEVDVCLAPHAHLRRLLQIESELGRVRREGERWAPRTIDLDLLWQGGLRLETATLTLPHPRLHERSFVLAPLAELAPELRIHGRSVAEWLATRPEEEKGGVRPVEASPLL